MISVRDTVGLKEIGAISARDTVGLKEIAEVYIRDAGGLKLVYNQGSSLAVYVPASTYGAQSSSSPVDVVTEVIAATPTGGVAPYSYLWTRTDGGGGTWDIIFPTAQETSFRANDVAGGDSLLATFKVTVTDSRGIAVDSININATADNYGGFA